MAVTMKNPVFWDVTPCGSSKDLKSTRPNIQLDGILHPRSRSLASRLSKVMKFCSADGIATG
jgi:hypothetical protein